MITVTVETRRGYTEVIPFNSKAGANYLTECIATNRHPMMGWFTQGRYVKNKDITRVISVEEEN